MLVPIFEINDVHGSVLSPGAAEPPGSIARHPPSGRL